ncbi:DUF333 domain-containing protein [Vibrio sp. HN007]|uniref:DUF333 domain-containing protein n=1 Tax=Vibrio iocasae TaxID=3098914 RepID=UPI0035D4FCC2
MNRKIMLAGIGAVAVLAGCAATEPDEYDVESYESISNQAAVYCVHRGGELISFTEDNKRVKYCVFSEEDKTEIHEYYEQRHEHEKK